MRETGSERGRLRALRASVGNSAADQAIEVCDGPPSFVEEDLDYWVDTVGQFCPRGATVIQRLE